MREQDFHRTGDEEVAEPDYTGEEQAIEEALTEIDQVLEEFSEYGEGSRTVNLDE